MDAIILAGGKGTRLAAHVPGVPKPLAPIHGKPFLDLLVQKLIADPGIDRLIFSIGHMANVIRCYYHGRAFSKPVLWMEETSPLGTGGALYHALGSAAGNTVLALNGDSYLDFSLQELAAFHQEKASPFSLCLTQVEDGSRYGCIEISPAGRILRLQEKPFSPVPALINAGVYLVDKSHFLALPFKGAFSLEKDGFPWLLDRGMFGKICSGIFIDIGTKASYEEAQSLLAPLTR